MTPPDAGVVALGVSAIVAIVVMTGIRAAARGRRGDGPSQSVSLAPLEQRMARLEQAVDVIAVEMERVSESQRFLTKLLAERTDKER